MLVPSWLLLILIFIAFLGAVSLGFVLCYNHMQKKHPKDYALVLAKNGYLESRVAQLEQDNQGLKTELENIRNTILSKIVERK
jgi:hypothetical protein